MVEPGAGAVWCGGFGEEAAGRRPVCAGGMGVAPDAARWVRSKRKKGVDILQKNTRPGGVPGLYCCVSWPESCGTVRRRASAGTGSGAHGRE